MSTALAACPQLGLRSRAGCTTPMAVTSMPVSYVLVQPRPLIHVSLLHGCCCCCWQVFITSTGAQASSHAASRTTAQHAAVLQGSAHHPAEQLCCCAGAAATAVQWAARSCMFSSNVSQSRRLSTAMTAHWLYEQLRGSRVCHWEGGDCQVRQQTQDGQQPLPPVAHRSRRGRARGCALTWTAAGEPPPCFSSARGSGCGNYSVCCSGICHG